MVSKRQNKLLKSFFDKKWSSHLKEFEHSGYSLIYEINKQNPENVIDIGCGDNVFKGMINNLTGIDIVNKRADMVCDIMEIELDLEDGTSSAFDIALALGSINFGAEDDIVEVLEKVYTLLKPGGKLYMRVNPGIRHGRCKDLIIFPWSAKNIDPIGLRAGFKRISPIAPEYEGRLFFIYKKV